MALPIFQVDAFADAVFKGNPAAVMPLQSWLDDSLLQAIAMENNLSETAYIVKGESGAFLYVYEFQEDIAKLAPDFARLLAASARSVIVCAPGDDCDVVCRPVADGNVFLSRST